MFVMMSRVSFFTPPVGGQSFLFFVYLPLVMFVMMSFFVSSVVGQ
jgi:hypothetical protein